MKKRLDTDDDLKHTFDSMLYNLINWGLVSLMLGCLGFVMNQLISVLYPAWEVSGFSMIAFLIAFESLISYRLQQKATSLSNPFTATLAEIVLIALSLKIFSMLLQGWQEIWPEIISWQRQFMISFFDPDFLLLLVGGLSIWLVARLFSQPLTQLEEDETLMAQEKLGHTFNDRQDARKQLITTIFSIGCLILLFMLLMNSHLIAISEKVVPLGQLLTALMLYFTASFIVISLNQFLIMKARWYFNEMAVNPGLSYRWLFASILFILITVLLVTFLPTDFIPDFYPLMRFLSNAFVFLYGIVQAIIIFPIVFLISVINAIFSGERINEQIQEKIPEFTPQITETANSIPWTEGLKSLIFWVVFIGIVFLTLRYYLKNHGQFRALFQKFHLKAWLSRLWAWLKNGWQKTGQVIGETISIGMDQLKKMIKKPSIKLPKIKNLIRGLPPRHALILLYIDWIRWNQKQGIHRQAGLTPHEYAALCQKADPACEEAIQTLTAKFMKARYSCSSIDPSEVEIAQKTLAKLKKAFLSTEKEPAVSS